MSYMSRLDEARRLLVAGDFLGAEAEYWVACEEWEHSRFRAPLLEKGVDPLLRLGGRIIGRDASRSVIERFSERANRVRADLDDVATLHARQASEKLGNSWESLDPAEVAQLAGALEMQRDSRIFHLDLELVWPLTRAYLGGCLRHGLSIDVALLPDRLDLEKQDADWLVDWGNQRGPRADGDVRAVSAWLLAQLDRARESGFAQDGPSLALSARLALDDPLGAGKALALSRYALAAPTPPRNAAALLRLATGLACNEDRLASPCFDPTLLDELEHAARRLSIPWPPPEWVELMERRHAWTVSDLVAVSWLEDPAPRLLILRLVGERPADALVMEICEEGEEELPAFRLGLSAARRRVDQLIAPSACVLAAAPPPAWLSGLLSGRQWLSVDSLEGFLERDPSPPPPASPTAPHPLFDEDDSLAAAWAPLLSRARWLFPRLLAVTQRACFRDDWGRANLRALGLAGVGHAETLARVLDQLPANDAVPMDVHGVPGSIGLSLPPLQLRPRAGGGSPVDMEAVREDGDHLLLRRPRIDELAGWAVSALPVRVLVDGDARAREVAAAVSSAIDPKEVGLRPQRELCAESSLRLLERWVGESVATPDRGNDVLWLYEALATAPEADMALWSEATGREEERAEFRRVLEQSPASCDDECRHRREGLPCFPQQLAERRASALVWVETFGAPAVEDEARSLLVDDLVPRSAEWDGARLETELATLTAELSRVPRAVIWLDAGPFGAAVRDGFPRLFDARPELQLHADQSTRELRVHFVDDGYRTDSKFVGKEGAALVSARAARLMGRSGTKLLWHPPGVAPLSHLTAPSATGAAESPTAQTVIVPTIGTRAQPPSEFVFLRLLAAATHAEAELACLDPRAAFARRWIELSKDTLRAWLPERVHAPPPYALLDELPTRELPQWRSPIDARRIRLLRSALAANLEFADDAREEAVAELLGSVRRHAKVVLGGLRDSERIALAALVARLAQETRDGGPLQVRTVVWLDDASDRRTEIAEAVGIRQLKLTRPNDSTLEETLLEIDRGQVHWLQLDPALLSEAAVERWARRQPQLLWMLPHAESWVDGHPGERRELSSRSSILRSILEDSAASCVACADDPDMSEGRWLARLASMFGLTPRGLSIAVEELDRSGLLLRELVADPLMVCAHCGQESPLSHPYHPCPACGVGRGMDAEARQFAARALRRRVAEWIFERGAETPDLILTPTARERASLAHAMGLEEENAPADEAPTFFSHAADETGRVRRLSAVAALYAPMPQGDRCVLVGTPPSYDWLRAVRARLCSAGWNADELVVLDHPVGWIAPADSAERERPDELRRPRWAATRAEVESRYRQTVELMTRVREEVPLAEGWLPRQGLGPPAADANDRMDPSADPEGVRLGRVLRRLEEEGVLFESDAEPAELVSWPAERASESLVVRWLIDEGLLEVETLPSDDRAAAAEAVSDLAWKDSVRGLDPAVAQPIPEPVALRSRRAEATEAPAPGWILGAAGSGRSTKLLAAAQSPRAGRRRALLLAPNRCALLAWAQRDPTGDLAGAPVEIATVEELSLGFLRRHHQLGGMRRTPRLIPEEHRAEGQRVRGELLREISRRYAAEAGGLPPMELGDLRLLLEGRVPQFATNALQASAGEADELPPVADAALLQSCAEEARREAGWITPSELRSLSRDWLAEHPYVAEGWRQRYGAVLMDDVHAFDADEVAFADRLFPQAERWWAGDPILLDEHRLPPKPRVVLESGRLPKELVKAAGALGLESFRRWNIKSRRRGRGNIERVKVLHLDACAAVIARRWEEREHQDARTAVLVSHQGDLRSLASRLRDADIPVCVAQDVARYSVFGPREFLAVLCLVLGLEGDRSGESLAGLARLVLRAQGLWHEAISEHELARRLISWRHGVAREPQSLVECYLNVLLDLQRRLASIWTLSEAAECVAASGILSRVLDSDAARGRIAQLLEEDGTEPWRAVPGRIDVDLLEQPLGVGARLWLLRTAESAGLEFDHVYALCSGHESPEHHFAALSRARESFTLLYAERDPFEDRL